MREGGPDIAPSHGDGERLCDFLQRGGEEILSHWEAAVRLEPHARPLSAPALRDHIPEIIAQVALLVRQVHEPTNGTLDGLPETHALERLDVGFDLEAVVHELGLLRHVVLRLFKPHTVGRDPQAVIDEILRFDEVLSDITARSVATYAKARERTLVAVDRISAAALGTGDVQSFLPQLIQVLLETTEAVDSGSVFLREGDTLTIRAAAGLDADQSLGFSVRLGEGLAGHVAMRREPMLISSAAPDAELLGARARDAKIRAMYAVPLIHDDEVIGVAAIGSRTAFDFSLDDKQLFRAMVRRATSLLVQAQLLGALRASEQRFRLLVDGVRDYALFMLDVDGHVSSWNLGAERIEGYAADDVLGRHFSLFFPEETREAGRPEALLQEARESGRAHDVGLRQRGDGSTYWADVTLNALRDQQGALRGFAKVTRDVTERRNAEVARGQLEEELRAQRLLLDEVLSKLPVGIVIAEAPTGRLVRSNAAFDEIWRRPFVASNDIEGYRAYAGSHRDGRGYEPSEWPLARAVRTGESVHDLQIEIERGDGTRGTTLQSAVPVRGLSGDVIAAVVTVVDITDRIEAEKVRERFVGVLGHDLRNPIQTIMLAASSMARAHNFPDAFRRGLSRIDEAADRMQRMISDLLDLTRGRLAGGIPITRARMNIRHVVRHVIEELELEFPSRTIHFVATRSMEGDWDRDRIHQLAQNLLRNALKHGEPTAEVLVELKQDDGAVELRVENRGEPIPRELLKDIFLPFRQARSDDSEGLGLGLYIVAEIVKAHGGSVTATSNEAEGTIFVVRLPRVPHR